ncbi:uncharacterized protein LOC132561510 [Ylistrum balloti]|uniref:uncharacterized protein LOC132561510 n=1 Tax=Ylistrum balloti TaxID=509963 RepID=UPI002905AFCF|nr:uncharacterized protein LOC132561510 [Ylistrum balloti]
MSARNIIKSSAERAKTAIGLKSSHKECMESVSELLEALEKERQMEQVMLKSVEQWTEIIEEITSSMDSATPSESEWKNRFHSQRLFNQMLNQEIGRIKTELYMLKQSRMGVVLPVTGHAQSKSPRSSHCRESQAYINCLQEKLKSLESLYNMYEHQRDDASRDYHRLKEEINKIVKDVWFKQKSRIKNQEESDQKEIAKSNKHSEKITLPPIREKTSYLQLHGGKSVTSKVNDRSKKPQAWRGVGKLPPISNTEYSGKGKDLSSRKTTRPHAVQKKAKTVTNTCVLPPIEGANRNEVVNQPISSGRIQTNTNNKLVSDPKLSSMRLRRIANMKTETNKGRVSDGFQDTDRDVGNLKQRPEIQNAHVNHVDDQRAGSICSDDDLGQRDISAGPYTEIPIVGESSEKQKGRYVPGIVHTQMPDSDNLHGLSPKSLTQTTLKSALKKSDKEVANGENESACDNYRHENKTRSVSKRTKKCRPEALVTTKEYDDSKDHKHQLPAIISPTSKQPTKRLKSAFVRSGSKCPNDDGKKAVSPSQAGISPTGQEDITDVVDQDFVLHPAVTTSEKVYKAEDTSNTGARRHMGNENTENVPKRKKSVTINDKTTVHYP